jgi:hypothetical protein
MRRIGHIRQRSPGSWELRYGSGIDGAMGKRRITTAVRILLSKTAMRKHK